MQQFQEIKQSKTTVLYVPIYDFSISQNNHQKIQTLSLWITIH